MVKSREENTLLVVEGGIRICYSEVTRMTDGLRMSATHIVEHGFDPLLG